MWLRYLRFTVGGVFCGGVVNLVHAACDGFFAGFLGFNLGAVPVDLAVSGFCFGVAFVWYIRSRLVRVLTDNRG